MTSYLDSHRTTHIKLKMLSGVQAGNGTPHDKYNIRDIAHMRTNQKRRHFYAKTTSAKLYIYIGVGARDLYIDEAHTALHIFRFAVFFFKGMAILHPFPHNNHFSLTEQI